MKSSAKKVELAPYDDLFSTEESRQDAKLEKIQEIPLSELHPFKGHPFKVKDDEAMMETADSVRQYDSTVYPPLENVPRRFSISHRNRWMVESADVVVAYVLHDWGGAATTLRCAKQKKKQIISYRDEMGS